MTVVQAVYLLTVAAQAVSMHCVTCGKSFNASHNCALPWRFGEGYGICPESAIRLMARRNNDEQDPAKALIWARENTHRLNDLNLRLLSLESVFSSYFGGGR